MAKENRARYAVLGMLHYGDLTGYEIRKRLNEMVGYFWQEPSASVYPALRSLEEEGFVTAHQETPETGPARIRYSLAKEGRAFFATWLAQTPAPTAMRNEFALKFFFGNLADPARLIAFVENEKKQTADIVAGLASVIEKLPGGEEAAMWRLIADYGRTLATASLEWCDRAKAELEALAGKAEGSPRLGG